MPFDQSPVKSIAPLRNVAALYELVSRVQTRASGLPGMACFFGPSGYGKTHAAIYSANKYRAYHVQVKSVWTRKHFASQILAEMGIKEARTLPSMIDQIGEQLSLSNRPLIVDESDFLVDKNLIEVVRDIYESSHAAIILIGEESLPQKLRRWERIHGRMLDWVGALPACMADARALGGLYCGGVVIADDLLTALFDASGGSVRRVCVNLDRVREFAQTNEKSSVTLADYGADKFFTGNPPARRGV